MNEALDRLGRLVRERRTELALSQAEAARDAQVSDETWLKVENGRKVSDRSLARVERRLGWARGSVDVILNGGDPPSGPATDDDWASMTLDEKVDYLEQRMAEVRAEQRRRSS